MVALSTFVRVFTADHDDRLGPVDDGR